jgi:hypothetical protein
MKVSLLVFASFVGVVSRLPHASKGAHRIGSRDGVATSIISWPRPAGSMPDLSDLPTRSTSRRPPPAFHDAFPTLPDRRVLVEFQRLLAMLGDGHSLVYLMPATRASFGMLPLDLYLFADGLFIIDGTGPAQELIGGKILRFGPRTTEEILQRMEPFVSRDNAMGLKAFASLYLIVPAFLEAWGATDDPDRVRLTIMDAEKRTREITLAAGPARRTRKRLYAPTAAAEPPPLYLQHTDREYWMHPLPDHGALYVQFNQVANAADAPLSAFAAQLRARLATLSADYLIVDVRHNNGGNHQLLDPLLETIAEFAARSPRRGVYILTSRATFSAAQNFITRIERRVPHGSRPTFRWRCHHGTGSRTGIPCWTRCSARLPRAGATVSRAAASKPMKRTVACCARRVSPIR